MKKKIFGLFAMMMVALVSVSLVSCGDDDSGSNGGGGNSALVGIWTEQRDNVGVIGFKFTADGKAYYNEWNKWEEPDFSNVKSPGNWTATSSTIRITHSSLPDYYEEYAYTLSEDGKTLTLNLVGYEEDRHLSSGVFTKYSK